MNRIESLKSGRLHAILSIFLLVIFTGFSILQAGNDNDLPLSDHQLIDSAIQSLAIGWNAKSGAQFAAGFAEDGFLLGPGSRQISGRATIATSYQKFFETAGKSKRMKLTLNSVRLLSPTSVIVYLTGRVIDSDEPTASTTSAGSAVITKTGDKWQIVSLHVAILPLQDQGQSTR